MNNHTQGPWVLSKAHSTRVDLINTKKGEAIGEIVFADVRNPADARLIAAAPELLDALQGLMNYVGGWDAAADHPCGKARDAIQKATGV